jgi:hypothetical protein
MQKEKIESVLVHGLTRGESATIQQFIQDAEEFPQEDKLIAVSRMAQGERMSPENARKWNAKIRRRLRVANILKKMTAWEDIAPEQALATVLRDAREQDFKGALHPFDNLLGMLSDGPAPEKWFEEKPRVPTAFEVGEMIQEMARHIREKPEEKQEKKPTLQPQQEDLVSATLQRAFESVCRARPSKDLARRIRGHDEILRRNKVREELPWLLVHCVACLVNNLPLPEMKPSGGLPILLGITPQQILDTAKTEFRTVLALKMPAWARDWEQLWEEIGESARAHLYKIALAHLAHESARGKKS